MNAADFSSSAQALQPLTTQPSHSVFALFPETFKQYSRHGVAFTRVLLLPLAYQVVGMTLAILLPYWFVNWFSMTGSWAVPLLIAGTLLTLSPGIAMFARGFWQYLVYMVSLNLNVMQSIHQEPIDFKKTFSQVEVDKGWGLMLLLAALTGIWLVPALLAEVFQVLAATVSSVDEQIVGIGVILSAVILVGMSILSIYFSMSLQILAFESLQHPLDLLKGSFWLVRDNFWRVVTVILIFTLLTNVLASNLVLMALDLTHVTDWFAGLMHGFLGNLLDGVRSNPRSDLPMMVLLNEFAEKIYNPAFVKPLAMGCLYSLVVSLFLPLWTIGFTLLYADLVVRKKDS